jgi:hypothetical protein
MGFLAALVLACLAACSRDFDNPYLPSSSKYAGAEWSSDGDGNGVADSVEKYAPGCGRGPDICLSLALDNARALASGGGDSSGHDPDVIPVEAISASDLLLAVGETKRARILILPGNATSQAYELSSEDGRIAIVTPEGIYGAGPGSTTITVHALDGSDKEGRFLVTVSEAGVAVKSVEAEDMGFYLFSLGDPAAQRKPPIVSWKPENATDKGYTLHSNNPDVARIVGDSIEPGGAIGKTMVTLVANDGGHRARFRVTVGWLDLCGGDC